MFTQQFCAEYLTVKQAQWVVNPFDRNGFKLIALVFIPDSEEEPEEEVRGFTDDNKEWLKPAKANKKKQGKLSLGGDSDDDEDASDDDDEWDDMVS